MNSSSPALLSTPAAAALLGLKPQSLRKWRWSGIGPPYIRLGSGPGARVAYRLADIEAWLTAHTFAHTAHETTAR